MQTLFKAVIYIKTAGGELFVTIEAFVTTEVFVTILTDTRKWAFVSRTGHELQRCASLLVFVLARACPRSTADCGGSCSLTCTWDFWVKHRGDVLFAIKGWLGFVPPLTEAVSTVLDGLVSSHDQTRMSIFIIVLHPRRYVRCLENPHWSLG